MSALGLLIIANHPWLYFAAMILFGLGGAFMGTAPAAVVGDLFGGKGGQVIAVWQMAGDAGMIIGPILLGVLADLISYRAAFITSALIFTIAIVMGSTLQETRNSHKKRSEPTKVDPLLE
jgi:MFS family permease